MKGKFLWFKVRLLRCIFAELCVDGLTTKRDGQPDRLSEQRGKEADI